MTSKRIFSLIVCIVTAFVTVVCAVPSGAITFTPNFDISSEAAVMINLDKNVTVYVKNGDKKMYPASLTKIMTAMVVLDNVSDIDNTEYEAPLVVFDELYGQGASAVGLIRGEITTVKDLLYSLMLKSACESAGILAYNVGGGSISNFVDMMNAKAKAIGCSGTNFTNPHGLYDSNQFTNANDMAKIAKYAVDNYPKLVEIACTPEYEMAATNMHEAGWAHIYHTNSMLNRSSSEYYQYVKGFKTGTLDESGRNLCTLGSRDGNNYLLVTLGSPLTDENGNTVYKHYDDHRMLYEWAFDTLEFKQVVSSGKEVGELGVKYGDNSDFVRLVTGEDYSCIWDRSLDTARLKEKVKVDESLLNEDRTITAPVEKGTKLGEYSVSLSGTEVCTVDLVAQETVTRSELRYNLDRAKNFVSSGWFIAGAAAFILLVIIYSIIVGISRKKKKKKRNIRKVKKKRNF
ncbi:MAG: D-alanyl-D-alanine carboxypeptidase [Oscillospiraceae bacterium]|nr:D-alanyl-D-alanine carboxypeptidase [Oscillospiraceae bacterium]MBQ4257070.1 D-alanyl-D-alanine carboxypeptidase [Oscillospiraceae bacterium]MBQ9208769.1 D-alanyl-D-alanine carboxypeptidase [Oscillospiraceae bacterium]MBR4345479.1 D-alanyl-D-alanine carboxypeptidase [Oscillospiraceae bacterium]